jgi:pSer/pThr/pTyr-binding forkhead associated (FHA) protein
VTGLFPRIERVLEGVVEGGSRRLFRQPLQPIELAKAAARAMQAHPNVGTEGLEVPSAYRVRLNPADYAQFEPYRRSLEGRLARYLVTFAEDRGLRPVAQVEVTLEADERVGRRRISVDARMADPESPATRPVAPIQETSKLPRQPSGRERRQGALTLVLEDGRRVAVRGDAVSLGRALDNDVVISDSRVSRYHAEIVREQAGRVVRDLGSTNGTGLAGRPIARDRLTHGDVISLGGYRIEVYFDGAAESQPSDHDA